MSETASVANFKQSLLKRAYSWACLSFTWWLIKGRVSRKWTQYSYVVIIRVEMCSAECLEQTSLILKISFSLSLLSLERGALTGANHIPILV